MLICLYFPSSNPCRLNSFFPFSQILRKLLPDSLRGSFVMQKMSSRKQRTRKGWGQQGRRILLAGLAREVLNQLFCVRLGNRRGRKWMEGKRKESMMLSISYHIWSWRWDTALPAPMGLVKFLQMLRAALRWLSMALGPHGATVSIRG